MDTLTIDTYNMPITPELSQAFIQYHAYYSLPMTTILRIDPKANQGQWLYDEFKSALYNAWIEFLENSIFSDDEFDLLESVMHDQDEDALIAELESIFTKELAVV